mgnify:CR=1 FL=1|tara:strand:- start:6369 stop:6830 length:462 start_codon:yes stop_codon:yes gene_type:complete
MKKTFLTSITPTENDSSPTENNILLRGGYNMDYQVVNQKTIQLIDERQFGDALEVAMNTEEHARVLQAMLVDNLEGTIKALVEAYERPWDYSREVVVDLVTTINEINTFDFVVDESDFSEIFRANEALNDVFVVGSTEDDYEFCDDNLGEDFV